MKGEKMTNRDLVNHLTAQNPEGAGFIDRMKISYRPLVCPFIDLLNLVPEKSSVFDIGCGSGMFLSLVKEFRNPSKIGGIEISESLIENAQHVLGENNSDDVFLSVFDGKNIPDVVSEFDYIFMIDVYHHIPPAQQQSFMSELVRKMAPGSYLIFKDIEGSSVLSYWNKIHDLLLAGEIGKEPKSKEFISFIEEIGQLEVVSFSKRRMLLYPHFTLVLKKK